MAAAQLIAAVADDQRDRLTPRGADKEREEVARRSIGPLKVLHDKHQRSRPCGGSQQCQQLLEQARLGSLPYRRARHTTAVGCQFWQQNGQLPAHGAEHLLELAPFPLGHERAQRPDHRRVRELPVTERQTLPNRDRHALALGASGELGDQPALPDTRLTTDEHHGAAPTAAPLKRRLDRQQLPATINEARARDAPDHPDQSFADFRRRN